MSNTFADLAELARHLRVQLDTKKFVLLYAYNGTGKTRLSTAFKNIGKTVGADGEVTARDTLYFNAFTEDLFQWDNDLANDSRRVLKINSDSRFFAGLAELEMDNRIRPLLNRYADFDFRIDTTTWTVSFSRNETRDGVTTTVDDIKVSRGEENIFIWCFFLAIVQLATDPEIEVYDWVTRIYIDDPISSLDEHNAVMVANHLVQVLTAIDEGPPAVVSTHHPLFFNVLCNEFGRKARKYFLKYVSGSGSYALDDVDGREFLHHLATLGELNQAQNSGALYTHHFNMLRRVMEQTANFFGLESWKDCIKPEADDPQKTLYERIINLMSHGDYSLFEPREMMEENKNLFRRIFHQFKVTHPFNPDRIKG
ncbi:anticodon nuclease [Lysobacter xinjiangensis]|uniref:Anticodon nuclease n=1 Tax=Cognatilysobacter xinjiangensis TaxID=546892 RepID=A0ABQ3C6G8_9GAMM|nr:AAA family ATPase [Lysobacter xinjiangensis]GGZ63834.1 anticodon nuclease [Lysobacter xinjiangensis]